MFGSLLLISLNWYPIFYEAYKAKPGTVKIYSLCELHKDVTLF